jgi:hypothetical protein
LAVGVCRRHCKDVLYVRFTCSRSWGQARSRGSWQR